jgi:hypothetical protein
VTTPRRPALANRVAAALTAAAVLTGTAGCAGPEPTPATGPRISFDPSFGVTDRAWIEINIAMDEQLEPLLALVPQRAAQPQTRALAGQLNILVGGELSTLRRLHDRAGLPAENPHEGMVMPGMVTPSEVAQAATLDDTDFDALTAMKVKDYLAQGVNLAQSEAKYGVESRTKALAASGLATRSQILTSLSG